MLRDEALSGDSHGALRRYFERHLQLLPAPYCSQDCNRATVAHFALGGLDVATRGMGERLPEELCGRVVRWLYAQQVEGGFRGGPSVGAVCGEWVQPHLASTYSALVALLTAGDALHGVRRAGVLSHIRSLQRADGSVACMVAEGAEADLRFAYCAAAVSQLLGDATLSALDVEALQRHVLSCQSYEGGFGLTPHGEAHGGATYVAVATLHAAGRLQSALSGAQRRQRLLRWCMQRQGGGYTGRANKPVDSCYSFWLGATLQLLGAHTLTRVHDNRDALMRCFDKQRGGFGKEAECMPDIMHSYLGTLGAAIAQHASIEQQRTQQLGTHRSQPTADGNASAHRTAGYPEPNAVHSQSDESAPPSPAVLTLPRLPFHVALGVRR